ncbi:hypothetical protein AAFF_G00223160 [Aldrovandia affinis]|uniref:Uncharacterized protein n=1 Tax=Aldrovandia affinis TaxID=143900 RepID=A0AAD7W3U5_9TELE|nr:hypothetical protein AAFF_G00223160 [Aldrovandia affinis]
MRISIISRQHLLQQIDRFYISWLKELQECNFQIEHRAGWHHTNADTLSRCPCAELGCGQLHTISKAGTAVQESSLCTPATLMFGRELWTPVDLVFGAPLEHGEPARPEACYFRQLLERLTSPPPLTYSAQDTAGLRQKHTYDQHCKVQAFKPGDRVWIHCPVRKKGLSPKLQPGEVMGRLSEVTYHVHMPNRGHLMVLHQDRLAPYHPLAAEDAAGGQECSSPVPSTPPAAEEVTQHTTGLPTRQRRLPSYFRNYEVNGLGTVGSSGTSDPLGGPVGAVWRCYPCCHSLWLILVNIWV